MSILTRLLLVGMFVTLGGTSAANAKQAPLPDHVLTLAICHGRYTAVLENGWLIGGRYGLADIGTAPFIRRIDEEIAPEALAARPHVAAWWDALQARPAYTRADFGPFVTP